MAGSISSNEKKRFAVVTGANKGIGFEICKQLATHGVMVVLAARDENRGAQALEKLKGLGLSDNLAFHRLDVMDSTSIASLAHFVKTQFGKLDILVNNAGISGAILDGEAMKKGILNADRDGGEQVNWTEAPQPYELAVECLQTNYYGPKRMIDTFSPLLQLSKSPRVVNVSSSLGKLANIPVDWVKSVLNDAESLTEEKIEKVLNEFLKDFKEGSLQAKGWPSFLRAYIISKAALNAYTRILAKKYPDFCINCACPGFVKTDINLNTGFFTVEEGAQGPVRLALLPDGGPSGLFFVRNQESSYE